MKSFQTSYLENLAMPPGVVKTIRQIGEYKGKQDLYKVQQPEKLKQLKERAIVQSTESSNRIEGITVPPQRLKEIMSKSTTPENRSEAEVAGYRDVLNTIYESGEYIQHTPSVVQQLHRDMMIYAPEPGGNWKITHNEITEIRDGQQHIRFNPVSPHLTEQYMSELHTLYRQHCQTGPYDALILIPLYLLDFLCIHPFSDGNGRMSRLLTVLLLGHEGYEVGRYLSLEKIIEDTKESYYETLKVSSQDWHEGQHNALPWVEYWLGIILAAYRKFEERVSHSPERTKTEIITETALSMRVPFSVSELSKRCPDISYDMIRHVLSDLKKAGVLNNEGRGRGAKWFVT